MKTTMLPAALAALFILPMAAVANGGVPPASITFTGAILEQGCTLSPDSANSLIVDLGEVSKTAFNGAGSQYSKTRFTITLKDCPESATTAQVRFDGTPDVGDVSLLSAGAPVEGVAIALMTADSQPLGLNQINSYQYSLTPGSDNNLNFYAAYQATVATDQIKTGAVNAAANFSVSYN